jgi:hypothetical protein
MLVKRRRGKVRVGTRNGLICLIVEGVVVSKEKPLGGPTGYSEDIPVL